MRRVEKVIGEARALRILRAARAQAPELLPEAVLSEGGWTRDCEIAERIISDLAEKPSPDGKAMPGPDGILDLRRGPPLDVFDPSILVPFMDAVQVAIEGVVAEMDPARLVREALEPAILAKIYPSGVPTTLLGGVPSSSSNKKQPFDVARMRRTAIGDVGVLAWEMCLLEVVRRVHLVNDIRRPFNSQADFSDLAMDGVTMKSPKRLKADAARKKDERVFKRRVELGLEKPKPKRVRKGAATADPIDAAEAAP